MAVAAVARIAEAPGLVVEREDLEPLGFTPPQVLELGEFVGMRFGQILDFREVLDDVIELPYILVERLGRLLEQST